MMAGVEMEEVCDALTQAYDLDNLAQMLLFRLDKNLSAIVATNAPFKTVVFRLVLLADQEGWDEQLIREARRFNAGNRALLAVYEKYGYAPKLAVQTETDPDSKQELKASSAGLEAILRQDNPALDIDLILRRLSDFESRVCRVDINEAPAGTGFLIGPDKVLTNYHVVKPILDSVHAPSSVTCLFDYKVLTNGTENRGVRVALQKGAGIPLYSPCTKAEFSQSPEKPLPTNDELDFAVLHLSRSFGNEPLAGPRSPKRGWETLPELEPQVEPDQGLMVVQHPRGEPMKLAIDTKGVIRLNDNRTRMRYRNNTEGGSSGSPVYDMSCRLVALHHLGDPAFKHPPRYNQGVAPLHLIRNKIAAAGL